MIEEERAKKKEINQSINQLATFEILPYYSRFLSVKTNKLGFWFHERKERMRTQERKKMPKQQKANVSSGLQGCPTQFASI